MKNRSLSAVVGLLIAPIGVATWILSAYTIGESIKPHESLEIGLGVALVAVSSMAYFLIFYQPSEKPGSRLGLVLIICGTLCMLSALALQFHLASLTAEDHRRLGEIMGERLKTNPSVNLHMTADYPESVKPIGYFVLFVGIWLAAVGIRLGTVPGGSAQAPTVPVPEARPPPAQAERP
jgi:drug/metabolite transporter (DMT)-like permease